MGGWVRRTPMPTLPRPLLTWSSVWATIIRPVVHHNIMLRNQVHRLMPHACLVLFHADLAQLYCWLGALTCACRGEKRWNSTWCADHQTMSQVHPVSGACMGSHRKARHGSERGLWQGEAECTLEWA